MLISGAGGGGFTQALLQGKQIGNQARALREQAHQRRQQLALGIGGLGLQALNVGGGIYGTIGNLANQKARTGILQEELGLMKAAQAPVPGSLFGHPELGEINPTLAALLVDEKRAGKSDTEVKLNLNALTNNLGAIDEAERTGKMSAADAAAARAQAQKGTFSDQPALLRAIQNVKDLEARPEHGAGAFEMDKMKGYSTDQMAETYAKIMADPTIQPDLKNEIAQELQRRQQVLGVPTIPSPEYNAKLQPALVPQAAIPGEPSASDWQAGQMREAYIRNTEAENARKERLRRALEWAVSQQQGIGPTLP